MKIAQINAYCGNGSTGKICKSISQLLNEQRISNRIYYTEGNSDYECGVNYSKGRIYTRIQSLKSRILGNNGFNSKRLTKKLISSLKEYKPDIIHLHNLHAQNINLDMFSKYVNSNNIKIIVTLHDCWMLTGYCMHFDMIGCSKWIEGCHKCPQRRDYSWIIDNSKEIWKKKYEALTRMNPNVVVPSKWMKDVVTKSKICAKDVQVIYNGINLDVFYQKSIREKNIDKHIILGVAERWDEKKGVDIFIQLCDLLPDNYHIIMVGTNKAVEKKLPKRIITIQRTENQDKLAEIYSQASVFVNTTREEVLGLVNIEALACGTPVVTFNTGGSPECLDEKTGIVVEKNNVEELVEAIKNVCKNKIFDSKDCINRAQCFDEKNKYIQYVDLYKKVYSK